MKRILLFASAVFGNLTILLICFLLLTIKTSKSSSALQSLPLITVSDTTASYPILEPIPVLGVSTATAQVIAGDAGEILVDNYFKKYNSPMVGQGKNIVAAAHKYQIPIGILPAIGQCEGNLGKSVPADSHNTWGFGIYGEKMTKFSSWAEGIEVVSKSIRKNYFDLGLTTPELMMPKYTPPSDGSWARCVNRFLAELE